MKHRWIGGLVLALFATLGCESGKQSAVLAMDEARLNIAAAEKMGAEKLAGNTLAEAKLNMLNAEARFADKEFGAAKEAAIRANTQAINAATEAKQQSSQLATQKRPQSSQKTPPKKQVKTKHK